MCREKKIEEAKMLSMLLASGLVTLAAVAASFFVQQSIPEQVVTAWLVAFTTILGLRYLIWKHLMDGRHGGDSQ